VLGEVVVHLLVVELVQVELAEVDLVGHAVLLRKFNARIVALFPRLPILSLVLGLG